MSPQARADADGPASEAAAETVAAAGLHAGAISNRREIPTPNADTVNGDAKLLQELYELMKQEGLSVLELKDNEARVKLVRAGALRPLPAVAAVPVAAAPVAAAPASTEPTSKQPSITSPLAGVFYRASSPATPPFAKEGDVVEAGQTLCIVEAMKVMNEIKAESRCRIVSIAAENSRPVTPGQTLFVIEPA